MVRGTNHLPVDHSFKKGQHLPLAIGLQEVRTELIPNPDCTIRELKTFGIEIAAREIPLRRPLMEDAKRNLLVRIMQKNGIDATKRTGLEINLVLVQIQHRIGRIGLGPKAVIGQDPETAIGHDLDPGVALQGLPLKGHRNAGWAPGG